MSRFASLAYSPAYPPTLNPSYSPTVGHSGAGGFSSYGAVAEWDASKANLVDVEGGTVETFTDIHNSLDMTVAPGENVVYTDSIYNQKVVTFGGSTNDYAEIELGTIFPDGLPDNLSCYVVFENLNAAPTWDGVIGFGGDQLDRLYVQFESTNSNLRLTNDINNDNTNISSTVDAINDPHIVYFDVGTSGTNFGVDGEIVNDATASEPFSGLTSGMKMYVPTSINAPGGANNEANMRIAHIVLFDRTLSVSDRTSIGQALARRWNITAFGYERQPIFELMDFRTTYPSEAGFTRDDANSTYHNSSGARVDAAVDEARIDHDPVTLEPIGLLCEARSSNSDTFENIEYGANEFQWSYANFSFFTRNQPGIDGNSAAQWTTSGNGASNIRTTSDKSYTAGVTYLFSVPIKPVNIKRARLRCPFGGGVNYKWNFDENDNITGAEVTNQSSEIANAWIEEVSEGFWRLMYTAECQTTATGIGAYVVMINDDNGGNFDSVNYITDSRNGTSAMQFLVDDPNIIPNCAFPHSHINGRNQAKESDFPDVYDIENKSYFQEKEGTIACMVRPKHVYGGSNQYILDLEDGNNVSDGFQILLTGTNNRTQAFSQIEGSAAVNNGLGQGAVYKTDMVAGFTWNRELATVTFFCGGSQRTYDLSGETNGSPTDIDRLLLAGLQFNFGFNGWFRKLYIADKYETDISNITKRLYDDTYAAILWSGQSNAAGLFESTPGGSNNLGERAGTAYLQQYYTDVNAKPLMINVASNGSDITGDSVSDPDGNWWIDVTTGKTGGAYKRYIQCVNGLKAAGVRIIGDIWNQGESSTDLTAAEYETALKLLNAKKRADIQDDLKIVISPIGRLLSSDGYQNVLEGQYNTAADEANTHLTVDNYDLETWAEANSGSDHTHYANGSYEIIGRRAHATLMALDGINVTEPRLPPSVDIDNVVYNGTQVDVPILAGQGTDITPSSGIEGFVVQDDNGGTITTLTINSAVRLNATTVRLTLATAPTGTPRLYYGLGTMATVDAANVLKDDNGLPVRRLFPAT